MCETEFKGQDLIPRFIVGFGILIGVLGFGGYLKNGSSASEIALVRQPRKIVEQAATAVQPISGDKPASVAGNANLTVPPSAENLSKAVPMRTAVQRQDAYKPSKFEAEPAEEIYYCGASTAKGTPCKHRVKGNVRCFQHMGMPAMLPPDRLRIK